ncbi:UbiA family prenyltransferase [Flavobacterium sp. MFBS3-15]|uniref:UbiA family prenyltransferase n=1 Tax=Flavobacterium sp. MFBS3-15 TaxID=2989816 RepID=UPI002235AA1B|nr:UbiA family prenyltransferase [Flavobacterium sp. MFBS3-15]MCW4467980.1 UbiA family prenyltransferase [Flavobacterium sp. MFBS3-15]
MKIFKLLNIPDLIILAVSLFIFRYGFISAQEAVIPALNDWQYALLAFSCIFIAAGAYFINNTAGIGHKEYDISEAQSYNLYIVLTIIGVGLGYYIANLVGIPLYSGIMVVAAATLYIYATSLKQTLLISNVLIAITTALPIVAIGIFNFYPLLIPETKPLLGTLFSLLLDYALFVFVIALLLTFVQDLAHADSDYNAGINTLPIALGKERTVKIVCALTIIPIAMVLYYVNTYLLNLLWAMGFCLLFLLGPVIYFAIKLWNSKTQKDFTQLVTVMKLVLFFTSVSIAVITFNIQYNAKG